jgi:hypothetical protein
MHIPGPPLSLTFSEPLINIRNTLTVVIVSKSEKPVAGLRTTGSAGISTAATSYF